LSRHPASEARIASSSAKFSFRIVRTALDRRCGRAASIGRHALAAPWTSMIEVRNLLQIGDRTETHVPDARCTT
jgi:hypothetical protein